VAAVTTTDRNLWRLIAVAAPVLLLLSLAYLSSTEAPTIRIAINGIVCGTYLATGLLAWKLRPANRTGRVMVATGLLLLLDPLQAGNVAGLVLVGLVATTVSDVLLGYLILAFPWGTLRSGVDRAFVAVIAVAMLSANIAAFSAYDPRVAGATYDNPFLLIRDPGLATAAEMVSRLTSIVVLSGFLAIFAIRWARASGPARRIYSPVLLPATILVVAIMVSTILNTIGAPGELQFAAGVTQALSRALIPIGFLVGLLRTRMARSAIADLVVELGEMPTPARLRDALANALGDPGLTVAYWSPEARAYLGADGSPEVLPSSDSGRAVTFLERDGQPIAAILHDEVLLDDPALVASVASAVRLSVENDRLQAEVEAQLNEVRESRARIVEAGDAERKRVERDLHDGAQQRLVSLTLALRLARLKVGDDADPEVKRSLDEASEEARSALSELRELARGIHPQILTEAGLGSAIESLANRSSLDVAVDLGTDRRFSPTVEATAYFVVSEALANVAKYAEASRALVRTDWHDDELTIEIADDGVGGAEPGPGGGLRGLADRLSAVDGRLEIFSPKGGGTRLLATIPTNAPAAMPG
jgi:signal transduction histidine kinase